MEEKLTFVFEARGQDKLARDIQLLQNAVSLGARNWQEYKTRLAEVGLRVSDVDGAIRRLKRYGFDTTASAFSRLDGSLKDGAKTLTAFSDQARQSTGVMGLLNQIAGKVGINLGALAHPALLAAAAIGALVGAIGKGVSEFLAFTRETVKLANIEDEARAAFQSLTGSVEAGTRAYEVWDKRVTESNLPRSIYSVEDAAKAYNKGLLPALLDAEEAFRGTSMSADGFIKALAKMREGQAPTSKQMLDYIGVLHEAGLSLGDVTSKTADHRKNAELLEAALARMAERQREAAGKTVAGQLREIQNQWHDYKEQLGHVLNEGLLPIISSFKELFLAALKSGTLLDFFRQLKELLVIVAPLIKELMSFLVTSLTGAIRLGSEVLGVFRVIGTSIKGSLEAFRLVGETSTRAFSAMEIAVKAVLAPLAAMLTVIRQIAEAQSRIAKGDFVGAIKAVDYDAMKGRYQSYLAAMTYKRQTTGGAGRDWYTSSQRLGGLVEGEEIIGGKGGKRIAIPDVDAEAAARLYEWQLQRKKLMASMEGVKPLAEKSAVELPDLEKKYGDIAKSFGSLSADIFSASLEKGGLRAFFAQLGQRVAEQMISTLVSSAVFKALLPTSAVGGLGGILRGILPFQHEGRVTRPTLAMVAERGEEYILSRPTVETIARTGVLPAGGRRGFEFGPERLTGNQPIRVNVVNQIAPALQAAIAVSSLVEQGDALRAGRES